LKSTFSRAGFISPWMLTEISGDTLL